MNRDYLGLRKSISEVNEVKCPMNGWKCPMKEKEIIY